MGARIVSYLLMMDEGIILYDSMNLLIAPE
jgi:hypothetical protein